MLGAIKEPSSMKLWRVSTPLIMNELFYSSSFQCLQYNETKVSTAIRKCRKDEGSDRSLYERGEEGKL
jgi:hypothetical protein